MELNRYANTRIEVLVGDFVNQLGSEREKYEQYLDRRSQSIADAPLQQYELLQSELDKFLYLRGNPLFLMGSVCRTTRPDLGPPVLSQRYFDPTIRGVQYDCSGRYKHSVTACLAGFIRSECCVPQPMHEQTIDVFWAVTPSE